MEEAAMVLERLHRIEALDRERARPELLLAELRALVEEAEAWVRAEAGASRRAEAAVRACREALAEEPAAMRM